MDLWFGVLDIGFSYSGFENLGFGNEGLGLGILDLEDMLYIRGGV